MPSSRTLVLVAAALACCSAGCQTLGRLKNRGYESARSMLIKSYHDPNAEIKMTKADELFDAKDYSAAGKIYAGLADNTLNPVLLAEKARFREAECLRERERFPDAVATYNRMIMDFPAGAYREQGCNRMYEIAYAWLEKDTLADIEAEQNGTRSPWWKRADRMVPNFFDKTRPLFDTEGEAVKALDHVQTHDIAGPNADKALFWLGYVNFYRGRFEEADHYYSQLVELHKDSKLHPVAMEMAIMSKNNSTGGSVYDSQKAAEALQLVHQAEATMPAYAADENKSAWLTRQKLAVRMQLAEKDFKMAQYYERTKHPASAYFYYELVCRRYPGTKLSDLAKERLDYLKTVHEKAIAEATEEKGGSNLLQRQWDRLTGKTEIEVINEPDRGTQTGPQGTPLPNSALPPALGNLK